MVIPVGSLINAAVIVIGAAIGMLLGNRLSEQMKEIIFQSLGLCTLVIGISMALQTGNPLYLVGSILLGGIVGESLRLDTKVHNFTDGLRKSLRSTNTRFTEGFVSSSVLCCIGAMAILGPLEEGLDGSLTILYTKSTLDFFAALALGAAFGSGVLFSSIPVLLLQGSITLLAASVKPYFTEHIQTELIAVGGVLIVGIGINLLDLKKIKLINLLPSLVIVVILCKFVTLL